MTWGKVQQILLCMNTNIDEVRRQAPTWNPDMPLIQWDTVNHRYVDQKETFIDYYSSQKIVTQMRGSRPPVPSRHEEPCLPACAIIRDFNIREHAFYDDVITDDYKNKVLENNGITADPAQMPHGPDGPPSPRQIRVYKEMCSISISGVDISKIFDSFKWKTVDELVRENKDTKASEVREIKPCNKEFETSPSQQKFVNQKLLDSQFGKEKEEVEQEDSDIEQDKQDYTLVHDHHKRWMKHPMGSEEKEQPAPQQPDLDLPSLRRQLQAAKNLQNLRQMPKKKACRRKLQ